jgi:hypothetical protein
MTNEKPFTPCRKSKVKVRRPKVKGKVYNYWVNSGQ